MAHHQQLRTPNNLFLLLYQPSHTFNSVIRFSLYMLISKILHALLVRETLFAVTVQSPSRVRLFVAQWTAKCQASLSITNSWSFLKFMSIELVMPSNHLILVATVSHSCLPRRSSKTGRYFSSSPTRTTKLQLTAEQPSTRECWIPPKKDNPRPRAKKNLRKTVGGGKSHLKSNPTPARDVPRTQTKPCVHQEAP